MCVSQMHRLSKLETLDEAVAKLLELAEYPKLLRWIQFPTALIVFLAHEDSPDSGAVYVYDRKRCVWLWVDFDDQNYGGGENKATVLTCVRRSVLYPFGPAPTTVTPPHAP